MGSKLASNVEALEYDGPNSFAIADAFGPIACTRDDCTLSVCENQSKSTATNATKATSQAPPSNQFFPTAEQRRRRGLAINSPMSAERQQFIGEERDRAQELHELKKAALRSANERRLANMREQNRIKILEIGR